MVNLLTAGHPNPGGRARRRGSALGLAVLAALVAPQRGARAGAPPAGPQAAGDSAHTATALAERLASREGQPTTTPAARDRAVRLYQRVGLRLLWLRPTGTLSDRGAALARALARVEQHGLRAADYPLPEIVGALGALSGPRRPGVGELAALDVLLTTSFAAFGADVLTGRVDPRDVEPGWHIDARAVDVDSALAAALHHAGAFEDALATLRPRYQGYDELRGALAHYRGLAATGGWPALPAGAPLRPGDRDARVSTLRRRLAVEGYLEAGTLPALDAAAADSHALRFDSAVSAGVARFQARHGLDVDSVVGPRTRAALDVPAAHRARQIAANLERLRWLPPDLGERFVLVNVPAFRLDAYDGGARALTMRVVVGSELEDRHTPIFSDSMRYVQFGPYWNVPRGIAIREILPHALRDRAYLERHDYEIVRGWGDAAPVVSAWAMSDAELLSPRYRVRQRPGPRNALGRVKFIFPNDFAVYLHDTPARALFADTWRAGSHGCVRVADPAALAAFVLRGLPAWDAARIGETLAAGQRVRVDLPQKLPVYLVYLTAFVGDGGVAFRSDLYDMDARLTRALTGPGDATARAAADSLARLAADAAGA